VLLSEALGVLSKSSPYAVSTEKDKDPSSNLDVYKDYLYIKTAIEKDFLDLLDTLSTDNNKIIFLCGSSGDGKSEILTRYSTQPKYQHIDFHLDATHSFDPKLNAVDTLNEIFTKFKTSHRPLVVGINLGMMAKFTKEGSEDHSEIRKAMSNHLEQNSDLENYHFLNFEHQKYAKFSFKNGKSYSEFASKFLKQLTKESNSDASNPFWNLMIDCDNSGQDVITVMNFRLLALDSVQDRIIELLMKTRLAKDQFLTARSLLDFIYTLVVNESYLFDNLFTTKTNELSERISSFDPALVRTEKLDKLVLTLNLNLPFSEFDNYKEELNQWGIQDLQSASSYIRLFYILQNADLGSNFHNEYANEFEDKLLDDYASVLLAHQNYKNEIDSVDTTIISDFYKHELFTALWRYINRTAPELKTKQFLISKENEILFATELKLQIDWQAIANDDSQDLMSFKARLKVNGNVITPALSVNINLFELIRRLNSGYRPNKYDKSCVILLDELVEQVKLEMAKSDTLFLVDDNVTYEAERDGTLIEISER
jgi:DNA phosphorothioation-dependent restriction protein DptF